MSRFGTDPIKQFASVRGLRTCDFVDPSVRHSFRSSRRSALDELLFEADVVLLHFLVERRSVDA